MESCLREGSAGGFRGGTEGSLVAHRGEGVRVEAAEGEETPEAVESRPEQWGWRARYIEGRLAGA